MVYVVTQEDVERSFLEESDLGKYGIIVQGCWVLFDTVEEAHACLQNLD